ncbi:MAG TPA: hypothetical protein EYQ56_02440 [Methylophilaceae bacterium]|nr:hypothetical protein [Methylophilaceae bacterium]
MVGIYLGQAESIHAPRTGGNVRVESINASYWKQCFNYGKRAKEANGH